MGILGSLFGGSEPKYNAPAFDPSAQLATDYIKDQSNRDVSQIAAEHMQGTDAGKAYISPQHEQKNFDQSLGMGNDEAARAALQARAERSYAADMNKLHRQANINAFDSKMASHMTAEKLALRKKSIESAVSHANSMAKMQADAARNSVIGDLLGAVGSFGGWKLAQGAGGGGVVPSGGSALGSDYSFSDIKNPVTGK